MIDKGKNMHHLADRVASCLLPRCGSVQAARAMVFGTSPGLLALAACLTPGHTADMAA